MRLNPYANVQKKTAIEVEKRAKAKRQAALDAKERSKWTIWLACSLMY